MKLTYFGADWCAICKSMYPIVKEEMLRRGFGENSSHFEYVDVDVQFDRATYNNICNLPTMIIEDDNGNVMQSNTGMMNIRDIKKFLENMK